jgi:predicted PurR-regulated permease PerM
VRRDGEWSEVTVGPARSATWLIVFTVGVFFAFVLGLLFLFTIRNIIFYLFFAIIVAAGLRPPVLMLSRRLPYWLALATVYISLLGVLVLTLVLVIPVIVIEVSNFIVSLPQFLESLQPAIHTVTEFTNRFGVAFDLNGQIGSAVGQAASLVPNVIALPGRIFDTYMAVFSVVALSFYWLLARDQMINWIVSLLPRERRGPVLEFVDLTERRLGAYVSGLLLVSAVIGVMTFIGLSLLGVRFAALLAIFAAGLEVIPIMGPIVAAVPIVLVAASQSLILGAITLGFFVIIQQLEGYVIMPIVQQRVIRLNPFVILLAILVGGCIAGIVGALLAVPIALALATVIDELRKYG